jgi:hypothetical protein
MGHPHDGLGRNRLTLKNYLEEQAPQADGQSIQLKIVFGTHDEPRASDDLKAKSHNGRQHQ